MANIIQKLSYIKENFPAYIKRYIYPFPKFKKEFIVMIDGTQSHGGLTDRFRNILSVYLFCKNKRRIFALLQICAIFCRIFVMLNFQLILQDICSFHLHFLR